MTRKNETMILQGYSLDTKKSIELEQPFSDGNNPKTYGMPITPVTFVQMLNNFRTSRTSESEEFKDLWWVQFSKASLFRILSQENCDFVRFYFAIPDARKKKASLLLQGVDSDGNTIKADIIKEVAERIEASRQNLPVNEEALLKSLTKLSPPLEEKGNGGLGMPVTQEKNIQSISDFFEEMEKDPSFGENNLATFVEKFLTYADSH